jgi:hypothetical protein
MALCGDESDSAAIVLVWCWRLYMLMAGVGDLCVVPTSEKAGCLPARKKRSTKAGLAVAGSNCWKEVTGPGLEGEKGESNAESNRASATSARFHGNSLRTRDELGTESSCRIQKEYNSTSQRATSLHVCPWRIVRTV